MGRHYHHRDNDRKLFVKQLNSKTTGDELKAYFSSFGPVEEAVVIFDHDTQESKRYGFVTFSELESVHAALAAPYHYVDGQRIYCNLAAMGMKRRQQKEDEEAKGEGEEAGADGEARGDASDDTKQQAEQPEDDEPIVIKDYFTYLRDYKQDNGWLADHPTFFPESPYQGMVLPIRPPKPMRREQMALLLRPLYMASRAPANQQHQQPQAGPPPPRPPPHAHHHHHHHQQQQQQQHPHAPGAAMRGGMPQQYAHAHQQHQQHQQPPAGRVPPPHLRGPLPPGMRPPPGYRGPMPPRGPAPPPGFHQGHHPMQQHQQHGSGPGSPAVARRGAASPKQGGSTQRGHQQQQQQSHPSSHYVITPYGPMHVSQVRAMQQQQQHRAQQGQQQRRW
ncbi:hypothetical protein PTSG_05199 [Salpingoeca rosetta]|uniref:RRM domain-containing protein n=1 Tax=Salpingoeca rosetta (strain ATCC 50818 / BSB-021) TaxID=946362 RepID=F2UAS9_SALR5|nr:uncharacterized protein PTSG_05199 [Salpingoeca rosetta]EGD73495.1 hypothetical protein PTSG_05199 [Salpingoeca rosetta]|eukprot:XP_004993777.1 hypothetical protein PTSG_05199 [Salpingoeca rosetta]